MAVISALLCGTGPKLRLTISNHPRVGSSPTFSEARIATITNWSEASIVNDFDSNFHEDSPPARCLILCFAVSVRYRYSILPEEAALSRPSFSPQCVGASVRISSTHFSSINHLSSSPNASLATAAARCTEGFSFLQPICRALYDYPYNDLHHEQSS